MQLVLGSVNYTFVVSHALYSFSHQVSVQEPKPPKNASSFCVLLNVFVMNIFFYHFGLIVNIGVTDDNINSN